MTSRCTSKLLRYTSNWLAGCYSTEFLADARRSASTQVLTVRAGKPELGPTRRRGETANGGRSHTK